MARHPTACLSYGEPPPSYPFTAGDGLQPALAAALLQDGQSVHVPTAQAAIAVLEQVGLTLAQIAFRLRVAEGLPL